MRGDVAERLKRFVGIDEEPAMAFVCARCGEAFEMNRQQCPACDGFDIRRRAWEGSGTA